MKEIYVSKNESEQRIDRFLKKYLGNASKGFIYKMLRKKRIKLNNQKCSPKDKIVEGDNIQFYFSDETLNKFLVKKEEIKSNIIPKIIYEDKNIILVNKPKGVLSHSANKKYGNNVVDSIISYLCQKQEYNPRIEKTFTPSICNRLDRNTSGIIIGAKNYETLKMINKAIKNNYIKKYYECIVKGKIDKDILLKGYLLKNEQKNKVKIYNKEVENSKKIYTYIKVLDKNEEYTLLDIDLITGRTHQIRGHLSCIGHPIIGDSKYGDKEINKFLKKKYGLRSQYLHAYKIVFDGLDFPLDYLNEKQFIANMDVSLERIKKEWFSCK